MSAACSTRRKRKDADNYSIMPEAGFLFLMTGNRRPPFLIRSLKADPERTRLYSFRLICKSFVRPLSNFTVI